MAFTRVQATTGTTGATFPISLTSTAFGSATTNGNALIVTVMADGQPASRSLAMTDSKGNQYTKLGTIYSSGADQVDIWAAWNIKGGASHTITVGNLGNTTAAIIAEEWSGLPADNSFEVTVANQDPNGVTPTITSGTSLSTNHPNAIVFMAGSTSRNTDTFTLGTGFSNLTSVISSPSVLALESKVVSSMGNQSGTLTLSATGAIWTGVLIAISDTTRAPSARPNPFHPGRGPLKIARNFQPRLDTTSTAPVLVNASITQVSANLSLTGGTQVVTATQVGSVTQVGASLTLSPGTQSVAAIQVAAISQLGTSLTLSPGTQSVTATQVGTITQTGATLTLSPGTQATAVSTTQVVASLVLTPGTQTVAAIQIAAVSQTSATLTLTGGTQAFATVNIVSISESTANLVLNPGTQVIVSNQIASITQSTANLVLLPGTQVVSSGAVTNASVSQLATTLTLSPGTQVVASSQVAAAAQTTANLVLSPGTQTVAAVRNIAISQLTTNLILNPGTQAISSSQIAAVSQLTTNLVLTAGTQSITSTQVVGIGQVSADLRLTGGTQSIATINFSSITLVSTDLRLNPGTQFVSATAAPSTSKYYLDLKRGQLIFTPLGLTNATIFRSIGGKEYEIVNSTSKLVNQL